MVTSISLLNRTCGYNTYIVKLTCLAFHATLLIPLILTFFILASAQTNIRAKLPTRIQFRTMSAIIQSVIKFEIGRRRF